MLLPRIELVGDERPTRLPQDPLLRQLVGFGIIADLHAGRQGVDVFDEVVVEEGNAAFDGMGHFGAVGEVGKQHIWEGRLIPDVLGGVEGVPFGGHEMPDADGDVLDHGDLGAEGAEAGGCPGSEEEVGEGHGVDEGGDGCRESGWHLGAVVAGPGCEALGCGGFTFLELVETFGVAEVVSRPRLVWFAQVVP